MTLIINFAKVLARQKHFAETSSIRKTLDLDINASQLRRHLNPHKIDKRYNSTLVKLPSATLERSR